MRFCRFLCCFAFITLGCNNTFEKRYTIQTSVKTLSEDNYGIEFEYELNVEFIGEKAQFEKLSAEYKTHIEYSIRAMSNSIIRVVLGRYTKEDINKEIPKEEIKEMVMNYLDDINFRIIDFNISKMEKVIEKY